MLLFHVTSETNAEAILRDGFLDGEKHYLTSRRRSGVWVADRPLDENEGCSVTGTILVITFPKPLPAWDLYEWREGGKSYREWFIPAELINTIAEVRIATDDDVAAAAPWPSLEDVDAITAVARRAQKRRS